MITIALCKDVSNYHVSKYLSTDHPKTPGMRKIVNEHGAVLESLTTLIVEGLHGQGRGITNSMKPNTAYHYRLTSQKLVYLAVQNDIIADAASIIADIGALDSTLRGPFIAMFKDANDDDASKYKLIVAKQELQRLRSIITECSPVESAAAAVATSEVKAAECIIKKQLSDKKKIREAEMTFKSLGKAGQFVDTHGEPVILPAALLEADAPTLAQRLKVHATVLKEMVLMLTEMEENDIPLRFNEKSPTKRDIVFKCMFLMSSAMLPQRKSPWQTAMFGQPKSPWTETMKLDIEFLETSPVYLYYRKDVQQWGITQLRTKNGARPWTPFPPEMNELISLYLGRLHAGYQAAGKTLHGSPIFPSLRGGVYGDTGFKIFERGGFQKLKLQGATVMNARHAVTLHCLDLDITPTSSNSSLADSIAAGMGTTTAHMFGELFKGRAWKKGAYSAAGEADGIRRAQAGMSEYWTWVFPKKRKRKRS